MAPAWAIPHSYELRRQLASAWSIRAVGYPPWPPGGRPNLEDKSVCTLYFCSMDHCLAVDEGLIQTAAALVAEREGPPGRTGGDVLGNLRQALQQAHDSGWSWQPPIVPEQPYTSLLQRLLVQVARPEDGDDARSREGKLRLGNEPDLLPMHLDLIDFLGELFRRCAGSELRVGGAAALMAQALTRVCRPGRVAIWPAFLSPAQARLFPSDVHCLHLDSGHAATRPACECGHSGHPESHSFPFEHGAGPAAPSLHELCPEEVGRVVVTAPSLHFDAEGRVDRVRSRAVQPIRRLLFSDEAGSQVQAVGREWKSWILAGVQGIKEEAWDSIEADLASIPPEVTLHVEITGSNASPWVVHVLGQYVDSLGISDDELAGFVEAAVGAHEGLCHGASAGEGHVAGAALPWAHGRAPMRPAGERVGPAVRLYEQAAWLAAALDLDRLYLHGHVVDLVIRRDRRALEPPSTAAEMAQEVSGTLFAKGCVASQAAGGGLGRLSPTLFGLKPAPAEAGGPARRRDPLPWALLAMADLLERWGSAPAGVDRAGIVEATDRAAGLSILKQGWFRVRMPGGAADRECLVAVVPVVWFRATPTEPLRTTGLGDVTSALSFYFGDYTVDPATSKRGRLTAGSRR